MTRQEALDLLTTNKAELTRRFGVKNLSLFGSIARDEARPDSDVDVLVEFEGPSTFRGFMGLLAYLEALFQTRVDLATHNMIRAAIRPYVEKDLLHVP